MAKGDAKKADTAINAATQQSNTARDALATTAKSGYESSKAAGAPIREAAQGALQGAGQQYSNFLSAPSADYTNARDKLNTNWTDAGNRTGGYADFASSGGFSPQDAANFRARGNAPISAAYSGARDEMMRGNALQGGYGANFAAGQSQLARQGGAAAAQAGLNTEASLADQIRQGRQFGITGMGQENQNAIANRTNIAQSLGQLGQNQDVNRLNAMGGLGDVGSRLTSLYGTQDPSLQYMQEMMGNQTNREGTASNLIQNRIGAASIPSAFQQALGNVGGVLNLAGTAAGAVGGVQGLIPQGGALPSRSLTQQSTGFLPSGSGLTGNYAALNQQEQGYAGNNAVGGLPTGRSPYAGLPSVPSSNIFGGLR